MELLNSIPNPIALVVIETPVPTASCHTLNPSFYIPYLLIGLIEVSILTVLIHSIF